MLILIDQHLQLRVGADVALRDAEQDLGVGKRDQPDIGGGCDDVDKDIFRSGHGFT